MSAKAIRTAVALTVSALAIVVVAFGVVPDYLLRSSRIPGWVNEDPDKLRLQYVSASMPWPGKIVVNGLEMRGSDPNVEWWFRMERAEIHVSLLDLLARRFHATSVGASGLSFRLRQRSTESKATAATLAPLPPIPGFAEVPVKGGPPYLRPPEAPGEYWRVEIDDLVAAASEIWVDQYRYEGQARVAGGFSLWPRRSAQVGPARVDFSGGRVWLGRDLVADKFQARADAHIASFDPQEIRGAQVYRFISGTAALVGEMPSVSFLNYYLRNAREPRLAGGRGKLEGGLRLQKGVGALWLTISGRRAQARYQNAMLSGDVVLQLNLSPWTPAEGEGRLSGSRVDLSAVVSRGKVGERDWWGKFMVGPGTLRSKAEGLELSSRFRADCRDARPLYTLFDVTLPKWAMELGKLNEFSASASIRLGPSIVEMRGFEARGGKFSIDGNYQKGARDATGAFLISSGPLAAGIDIREGKSSLKLIGAKQWYARQSEKARK